MAQINKAIVPESTSELQKIELMFTHLHKHLEYMTKLLESVVEQFSLANESKSNAHEAIKINMEFIESLFEGRNFEGKEQLMAYINRITNMGVRK